MLDAIRCTVAPVILTLGAFCAATLSVQAQDATAQRTLTEANRELFDKCIIDLQANVETWRQIGRTRPNEPVWNQLANDTQKHLDKLAATPIAEDNLAGWWTGDEGALAAFYKGTIYLDDNFAEGGRLGQSQKRWDYLKRTNLEEYNRQRDELRQEITGRGSVLGHEAIHAAGDKSERNAYLFQYRYLVAADVPFTNDEMFKVLDHLIEMGEVEYKGDRKKLLDTNKINTKKLDKRLGLDVVKNLHKEQKRRMLDMQREQKRLANKPPTEKPKRKSPPKPNPPEPEETVAVEEKSGNSSVDWDAMQRKAKRIANTVPEDLNHDESTRPVLPIVGTVDTLFVVPDAPAGAEPIKWSFYLNAGRVTAQSKAWSPPQTNAPHNQVEGSDVVSEFEGTIKENVVSGNLKTTIGPFQQWSLPGSTDKPWRRRHTYTGNYKGVNVILHADGTAELNQPESVFQIHTVILQGEPWNGKTEYTIDSPVPAMTLQGVWQLRKPSRDE